MCALVTGVQTCALPISSVKKGETLIDTAMTLNAMAADVIVIRHASSGAVALIADKVDCPVLNAGDGWHQHPTQALLDALTIRRRKGGFEGLVVAICGDVLVAEDGSLVRVVAAPDRKSTRLNSSH